MTRSSLSNLIGRIQKLHHTISELQAENKDLKEIDWEKCCQEFKENLIEENKDLKELLRKVKHIVAESNDTPEDWNKEIVEALKEK